MPESSDKSAYDLYIEHNGSGTLTKVGYTLARDPADQGGGLHWFPGTAPMLAAQFQSDPLSFDQMPSEIYVSAAFENLSEGAGFVEAYDPISPKRYNYSRGVDASWPQRMYISPLRNAHTGVATAPTGFTYSSLGLHVVAGRYLLSYDGVGTTTWTQRNDLGAGNAFTGPIVDFGAVLFAPAGTSVAYRYSTDGTTWTTSTLGAGDQNANFFTVRGSFGTSTPILWKANNTGQVSNHTSGQNGANLWSATVFLGHAGESNRAFITANNSLYLFKQEGFYSYDGTPHDDFPARDLRRTTNGAPAFLWGNGKIYTPYGDRLMEFDPQTHDYRYVFPADMMLGNSEINGAITAIAGDADWLYVFIKNGAGNSYLLKVKPLPRRHYGLYTADDIIAHLNAEVHTLAYLGANDCNAAIVVGPGVVHANNPCLVFGYGTAVAHFILPRSGLRPEDDSNYRFDTAGGSIYGSWITVGTKTHSKFLNTGRILLNNAAGTRTGQLLYEIDESGSQVSVVTGAQNNESSANVTTEVAFNRIRHMITLATSVNTASPAVIGSSFSITLNPPRKRMWTFDVLVGDDVPRAGGERSREQGNYLEAHLFDALRRRVTLYGRRKGRTYVVRILDIKAAHDAPRPKGDVEVYTVSCVEIAETTVISNVFVWGTSVYGSSSVWGA